MTRTEPRARTQRQLRVGEEVRHALAHLLERGELRDPELAGETVTVTEVRISPDLRKATVFVMPLGGDRVDTVVGALARARPFLRRRVAAEVNLKFVPELKFVADPSFDEAGHIDALLREPQVARDLAGEEPGSEAQGTAPGGEENGS